MKNNRLCIFNIIVVITFVMTVVLFIVSLTRKGDPFDVVYKMNRKMVKGHKLIFVDKTHNGFMVYSAGKVNHGNNNMYLVDMVKRTPFGYKWVGGGGHINRDIVQDKDFIFSAQLLNENYNISPTLFGVILDKNIEQITVTSKNGLYPSVIYEGLDKNEKFYKVSFDSNVSNERFFAFLVSYKDGKELEFLISDEVNKFQQGMYRYFYKEDIINSDV